MSKSKLYKEYYEEFEKQRNILSTLIRKYIPDYNYPQTNIDQFYNTIDFYTRLNISLNTKYNNKEICENIINLFKTQIATIHIKRYLPFELTFDPVFLQNKGLENNIITKEKDYIKLYQMLK